MQESETLTQEQRTSEPKQMCCPNEAKLTRYCTRCGRKLKAEASMKIGLGRVCMKKAGKKEAV